MNSKFKIQNWKRLTSSNLKAKELANQGVEPWTVIRAEEQTAGYGRKKTAWFSPRGGLYFSIILPKSKIEDLETLTILAAFVVAKTIKENFNLEPFIKLPNDVWVKGKKIAGILTENVMGQEVKLSIMGIGLNTNINKFPEELVDIATSLKIELGRKVSNINLVKQIVQGLKEQLKTISE